MSLPAPYYDDPKAGITIYHGDCRSILPELGRFDLLLTDPPYGIDRDGIEERQGKSTWRAYEGHGWDASPPDAEWLRALVSCASNQILWGGNFFARDLPANASWLVWRKGQDGQLRQSDGELAWTSAGCGLRIYTLNRSALALDRARHGHPTQKPVALMSWCLSFFPEAKTVVDPYMGSGPVAKACKDRGLRYVGIELVEKYCEIAVSRLRQEVLFGAEASR